jgi:GPH family glycoside/pentoside/hexuronide:cation symporter
MVVGVVTLPLIAFLGNTQKAWIITFGIYGFLTSLFLIITFLGTKERVKPVKVQAEKFTFDQVIHSIKKNKYWVMIFAYLLFTFVSMTAVGTANVYYAEYILNNSMAVGWIVLAQSIPVFIMLFIMSPIIKKFGKRNVALVGLLVSLIGYFVPLLNVHSTPIVVFATVLKGLGGAPIGATMFAFLADTIDYGEWVSGLRIEGILFSAGTLGQTLGMGLGSAIVGWLLGAAGFVSGGHTQNEHVLNMIIFIFIFIPAIFAIFNIIILMFYKLDKLYDRISKDLSNGKLREE